MRLVDGLPLRSSGSTSGNLSEDRLSWVIIRGVPGEAGNRAAISLCLEQSKDNRPESPHWKLGCLVDGNAIIFGVVLFCFVFLFCFFCAFFLVFCSLFFGPSRSPDPERAPLEKPRNQPKNKKKIPPTRIRTRDLEISVVKPSTVSRSAN